MEEAERRLARIPNLRIQRNVSLAEHTRFGIGGPAGLLVDSSDEAAFIQGLLVARGCGFDSVVLGAGTNLVVSDEGFPGVVFRYGGNRIEPDGTRLSVQSGALLQGLIDFAIERGLKGLETMAGIPGWVGAAIYGNAGAYGHSICERVASVRFFDGEAIRSAGNAECEFSYRESVFKRRKGWVILSAQLGLEAACPDELCRTASEIVRIRNEKYPPTMKCAGSIFKNLWMRELPSAAAAQVPERVVREGKVPAAWFLEQAGAKGMRRGDIHIASYHANLIYNAGSGTAAQLAGLIQELKERVRAQFGIELEEEVQYVGFEPGA